MFTIVIQAGGESLRMGRDKALLPFLGRPLIERVIERLASIADELLVTTNQSQDYRFLGVRLVRDLIPGRGALGGLYTALSTASHPIVGVVACDMPFVNAQLLTLARDLLSSTNSDLVIPQTEKGLEPFHAVYRRQTCLPAVESALTEGKWRVDAWFQRVKLHYLSEDEIKKLDPHLLSFRNVNTDEDLHATVQLARQIDDPMGPDKPGGDS